MAAKCEMEDRNSSESARHLFLRALRFHPENEKVYQEVSKDTRRKKEISKEMIMAKKCIIVAHFMIRVKKTVLLDCARLS